MLPFLCPLVLLFLVGCGGSEMTGKVTVDGVEVSVGTLQFNPDLDTGNDGPSIFADVSNGAFNTHSGAKISPGKNNVTLTIAKAWLDSKGQDANVEPGEGGLVATTNIQQSFDIPEASTYDFKFVTE